MSFVLALCCSCPKFDKILNGINKIVGQCGIVSVVDPIQRQVICGFNLTRRIQGWHICPSLVLIVRIFGDACPFSELKLGQSQGLAS